MAACLLSCKQMPQKATKTYANTTGIGISHDASVENPPEAHQVKNEEKKTIPPGSKVTMTETSATEDKPATTTTVIELPKDKGMDLSTTSTKTDLVGSKGFTPPKPPTPAEEANKWWGLGGIVVFLAGVFLCTPWGGTNFRVGGLIAAAGVGMGLIGKFIDQIKIPAPAAFIFVIILAGGVYYGYRVRHKQIQAEQVPTTK